MMTSILVDDFVNRYQLLILSIMVIDFVNSGEGKFSKIWASLSAKSKILILDKNNAYSVNTGQYRLTYLSIPVDYLSILNNDVVNIG